MLAEIVPGCQKKDASNGNVVGVSTSVCLCMCAHLIIVYVI